MALGNSGSDFSTLEAMANQVNMFGAESTFEHAQLSVAKLSQAFSSVATSMTATRTEMLSVYGDSGEKKKKNVELRAKSVPKADRNFMSFTRNVSRWKYDHEQLKDWPWKRVKLHKREKAAGFDVEDKPFGEGAERLLYTFYETDIDGKRLGKPMVAKESNRIDSEERKIKFHENFCRVQRKASELASLYNKATKKAKQLQPVESCTKLPEIKFLNCTVYQYEASDGTLCGFLVEQYLKGRFTKYNGNNGFVSNEKSESTIDLEIGTVHLTDFLQAFSHWVYCESDQNLLICDLQGVLNEEGRHPRFELTDPCICSRRRKGTWRFGKSDLRIKGIRNFRRTHKCNLVCKGLGLPSFGSKK